MVNPEPSATRSIDLRIGRVAAWTAGISSFLGTICLLLVPPVAAIAGQLTWSDADKEACKASPDPCTPSLIPGYAVPEWIGWAWVLILMVCLLACWQPRRWWWPQDRSGAPKQPGFYSSPEWIRGLAVLASFVNLAMTWGVGRGSLDAPGFLWPALFGLVVVLTGSLCIFVTARGIPAATQRGLDTGFSFWLIPAERRRRARFAHGERVPAAGSRRERRRG